MLFQAILSHATWLYSVSDPGFLIGTNIKGGCQPIIHPIFPETAWK